jgi:hypothetical protein
VALQEREPERVEQDQRDALAPDQASLDLARDVGKSNQERDAS